MSDSEFSDDPLRHASREEIMSALFMNMVMHNTNMALMFLGQVPHPESGKHMHDLEAARMFIDQLEMLEAKTKGNLSRDEEKMLQQSLTHLRLTFVQVIENPPPPTQPDKPSEAAAAPAAAESKPIVDESSESESRKRFSKKF